MLDVSAQFDLPTDRVWLNASHQGPLPTRAADAVATMVRWKQQPHHLKTPQPFDEVPGNLRTSLADLLSVPSAEITLANSSSYGLHLVANGLELSDGDEVIVAANDFPSDILPWVRLERHGVTVTRLHPHHQVLTADEIREAMTPQTRAVCLTWVHSFSGHVAALAAIGELCREHDAIFVVNGSQGVGAIPIAPHDLPIDALIGVGFKWLCGPYGTGFCWLGPRAEERIEAQKLYWLNSLDTNDLAAAELDFSSITPATVGRHDVFGTANFFNFAALVESVRLVADTGVDRIHDHNMGLTERLVAGVDPHRFLVEDRGDPERRSSIVFLAPVDRTLDEAYEQLDAAGIDVSRRRGLLRIAPHFYNTADDIGRTIATLNS
jgi:selenocysteine lyase/cysteine desulfurase